MLIVHPQYITDKKGKKISVVIPVNEFETLMEELDELEDIRLYDAAKKSNGPSVPIDKAFKTVETKRKSRK